MLYRVEDELEIYDSTAIRGKKQYTRKAKTLEIKSRKGEYGNSRRFRLQISFDLIEDAAMKAGDKVVLGKVKGASIWCLVPSSDPDAFILRKGKGAMVHVIDSMGLAAKLYVESESDVFDGWVDNCRIYFTPRR